jgi:hypothetical protein
VEERKKMDAIRGKIVKCLNELISGPAGPNGESGLEYTFRKVAPRLYLPRAHWPHGSFWTDWPYEFKELQRDEEGFWLLRPVNRFYRQIRMPASADGDWRKFEDRPWRFPVDPRTLDVWSPRGTGYLYAGGLMTNRAAFEDYGARLGRLISAAADNKLRIAGSLIRKLPPERKRKGKGT